MVGEADKSTFVQTLIDLHSGLFALSPEQVRASAEWRFLSSITVDLITRKTSTDVEGDWAMLEEHLRRCYRSIQLQHSAKQPFNPNSSALRSSSATRSWMSTC